MRDLDEDCMRDYASPIVREQSASVVQIESSKVMPMLILMAMVTGISIGLAVYAINKANTSEREARMLQYYLLELDAKVIKAGIKGHDEAISKQLEESKP